MDAKEENQISFSFSEEKKTDNENDNGVSPKQESMTEEEENRLRQEAEAKRRAEVARRIKEQAEASARRREEEDKLWEEAMAKRRAEKARRIMEEASAVDNRAIEEERRRIQEKEAEAKRRAEKEKRRRLEAATRKRAEQEKQTREEKEAKRKAEQDKIRLKVAEAKRYAQEEQYNEPPIVTTKEAEEHKGTFRTILNRKVVVGFLIGLAAIIGIWAFSTLNTTSEDAVPTTPITEEAETPQEAVSNTSDKSSVAPVIEETSILPLKIGDTFGGGIVFELTDGGKSGKIAHLDDAGIMPWQDAINIHERMGAGWRLPTFNELEIMYRTIGQGADNKGEFANQLYWSATEYDEFQARLLKFTNGNDTYHYNRYVEERQFQVRAVKDFVQ